MAVTSGTRVAITSRFRTGDPPLYTLADDILLTVEVAIIQHLAR